MSHLHDPNESQIEDETLTTLTRRRIAVGILGAAGALAVTPAIAASLLKHDDHDDEDDEDGDSDDHGHDDLDDHDDEDVRESIVEGTTEVHIIDDDPDGFFPGVLQVAVGTTVTFYNDEDDDHTATGADFDTGVIAPGSSAEVTFDTAGSFPYSCQIHPEMTGTIEVGDVAATPAASPAATPAGAASGETVTVTIADIAFDPPEIDVTAGTTVTWINEDQVPHTATALDGSFDTGTLDEGVEGSVTFDTPGTFDYRCNIHPSMTGTVNVS
jgi:plastocyanin